MSNNTQYQQQIIPQPGAKYNPLPIGPDGKLLQFEAYVGDMQLSEFLQMHNLNPGYYIGKPIGNGLYQIIGHYTCPP